MNERECFRGYEPAVVAGKSTAKGIFGDRRYFVLVASLVDGPLFQPQGVEVTEQVYLSSHVGDSVEVADFSKDDEQDHSFLFEGLEGGLRGN